MCCPDNFAYSRNHTISSMGLSEPRWRCMTRCNHMTQRLGGTGRVVDATLLGLLALRCASANKPQRKPPCGSSPVLLVCQQHLSAICAVTKSKLICCVLVLSACVYTLIMLTYMLLVVTHKDASDVVLQDSTGGSASVARKVHCPYNLNLESAMKSIDAGVRLT